MSRIKFGVSYFSTRDKRHFAIDLKEIKEAGFKYVIHTFSERDFEFYRDSVKELVSMTKDAGLSALADPWGVLRLFGGEEYSKWIYIHPEIRQIKHNGEEGYGACPNNSKTIELLEEWIDAVADMNFDGIFWDEIHLDDIACFCEVCSDLFVDEYGGRMDLAPSVILREFGAISKRRLMEHLFSYAKRKGLSNTLCVLPNISVEELESFVYMRDLDVFSLDPYPSVLKSNFIKFMEKHVPYLFEKAKRRGLETELWVQGFSLTNEEVSYIDSFFSLIRNVPVDRVAIWSFRATESMSYIRPENPELLWNKFLSYMRRDGRVD